MFARKSVDGILAAFSKTIADLGEVVEMNLYLSEHHSGKAVEHLSKSAVHREEADRAHRVAEKLSEIVL